MISKEKVNTGLFPYSGIMGEILRNIGGTGKENNNYNLFSRPRRRSLIIPMLINNQESNQTLNIPPEQERALLRAELAQMAAEKERLAARVEFLTGENSRLAQERDGTLGRVARLAIQNQALQRQIDELRIANLRLQLDVSSSQSRVDRLDPRGYCLTIGLNPRFLHSLPADKLDQLLLSLQRAYAKVLHPDVGGNNGDMARVNEAFDFLRDPQKRENYGR